MPEHDRRAPVRSDGKRRQCFDLQIFNRKWFRALLWVCVVSIAVVIFLFSSQSGEASAETSDNFVEVVIRFVYPDYDELPAARQEFLWSNISFYVRKNAHLLEYAALGFFLRWLMACYSPRFGALWSWLAGTLYASTDELHQLLSGVRSGMWQDVLLDSAGVLVGGLAALVVAAIASHAAHKKALNK